MIPASATANYDLKRLIRVGGQSAVFEVEGRASSVARSRQLVMKVPAPRLWEKGREQRLFDAAAALRQEHAALVILHDLRAVVNAVDVDPAGHFLVMEMVPGRTLSQLVAEKKGGKPQVLDDLATARLGYQLFVAIRTLAEAGFLHTDIKPDNLFVGRDGCGLRLVDLGCWKPARPVHGLKLGSPTCAVTPPYSSPEQVSDVRKTSEKSDVYSAAMTLWYARMGDAYTSGATTGDMAYELKQTLLPAMDGDPATRSPTQLLEERLRSYLIQSGQEVGQLDQLAPADPWATGQGPGEEGPTPDPTPSPPDPVPGPVITFRPDHDPGVVRPWMWWALGLVVVGLGAVGVGLYDDEPCQVVQPDERKERTERTERVPMTALQCGTAHFAVADRELTWAQARKLKLTARTDAVFCDDCPVTEVTWLEAVDWANRLSKEEGKSPCYGKKGEAVRDLSRCGYHLVTRDQWQAMLKQVVRSPARSEHHCQVDKALPRKPVPDGMDVGSIRFLLDNVQEWGHDASTPPERVVLGSEVTLSDQGACGKAKDGNLSEPWDSRFLDVGVRFARTFNAPASEGLRAAPR